MDSLDSFVPSKTIPEWNEQNRLICRRIKLLEDDLKKTVSKFALLDNTDNHQQEQYDLLSERSVMQQEIRTIHSMAKQLKQRLIEESKQSTCSVEAIAMLMDSVESRLLAFKKAQQKEFDALCEEDRCLSGELSVLAPMFERWERGDFGPTELAPPAVVVPASPSKASQPQAKPGPSILFLLVRSVSPCVSLSFSAAAVSAPSEEMVAIEQEMSKLQVLLLVNLLLVFLRLTQKGLRFL